MQTIGQILLALAFCLAAALPARADQANYEALLTRLAAATSQQEADQLSGEIWQVWLTAPDEAAQAVLDEALSRRRSYDFLGAIHHLDKLVTDWPNYAEGWNQRATLHFLRGDFEASLADVARVLALEPRHFGALSGKAVILHQQGRAALAQIALREALTHHPFLRERALLNNVPGTDL